MLAGYVGYLPRLAVVDTLGISSKSPSTKLIRFLGDQGSDGLIFTGEGSNSFEFNIGSC